MISNLLLLLLFYYNSASSLPLSSELRDDLNIRAMVESLQRTSAEDESFEINNVTNPEERGGHAQGDIMSTTRSGLVTPSSRWKNGRIPYVIEGKFQKDELKMLKEAMRAFANSTCVR